MFTFFLPVTDFVPDNRKHRGPHPEDAQLFSTDCVPNLRTATHDLSWLLSRGYATPSSIKLVGDRYALNARQRVAVSRSACSDDALNRRRTSEASTNDLAGRELWIDGYNVLTTIEAALSGGVILHARDGCFRDMASMHGSYRKVEETIPAIQLLGEVLQQWNVARAVWLLDRPVSNSGRLKQILNDVADRSGREWQVELVQDPDVDLIQSEYIVASADSQVIDGASRWFNLARRALEARASPEWLVDLSDSLEQHAGCEC